MKKLIIMIGLLLLPTFVFGSEVTIDKDNIAVNEGDSVTFTINSTDVTGRLDIILDNSNIELSSSSSNFSKVTSEDKMYMALIDDNGLITVNVNGLNEGLSNILLTTNQSEGASEDAGLKNLENEEVLFSKNISITVNHVVSNNAYLEDIKIDDVSIIGFDSSTTTYNLTVDKSSITIAATVDESHASVSGIGQNSLNYGNNKIELKVTAEDGTSKKTYTLNVTRNDNRDTNNYLKSLSVSEGSISFDKNITEYSVTVKDTVSEIVISAEAESVTSTVSGDGTKILQNTNNVYEVVVTAENGDKKTYTITVRKNDEVVVTYNSNGGTMCSPNNKTVTKGSKIGTLCTPSRDNYKFNGWYTESSGGNKVTSNTTAERDFTIYAQWSKIVTENPKTGINTPLMLIIVIAIISLGVFLIVRKRSISF